MRRSTVFCGVCLGLILGGYADGEEDLREAAIRTMARATRYFRTEVATRGGYLWQYASDFSLQEGERQATPSMIWVQPPGTPAVGMAYLEAYEATRDTMYLEAAREAAHALAWGQLGSGGWDYRIDFDPEGSKGWYYRRDVEAGDLERGERQNRSTLDDNTTQSALRLLMRVDKATGFEDAKVHGAALYGLKALLEAQYPNGAWPQQFEEAPDPEQFPVVKAKYPETWSREYHNERYYTCYTFNDHAISDVIETLVEAHHTYGNKAYLEAAKRGGGFMVLAQMPEPQPVWAQQYNRDMEPVWARRFEPPSVVSVESFGVMRTLMDLYVETGGDRFLEPIPRALAWAQRSALPDGRFARFYELETNRPLYFTKEYALTYSDDDLPTHYGFQVRGGGLGRLEAYYKRIQAVGQKVLPTERRGRWDSRQMADRVREVIDSLDPQGRWVRQGRMRDPEQRRQRIQVEVISCRTFNRNLSLLARYVKGGT